MEWRCTWCGKPHEEDAPPCDSCGHNKFERAIERVPAEAEPTDPVWVCTECGREHQKHSPPCSRCGNVTLEQQEPDYSDLEDLGGTSFFDVLEPKYAAGYVAVGVLGLILVLGLVGVINLPVLGGLPALPDAPGESEQVGNVSLAAVESAYVDEVNDRRAIEGEDALERRDELDWLATYVNREMVIAHRDGGPTPAIYDVGDEHDVHCPGTDVGPSKYHYVVGTADDPAVDGNGDVSVDALAGRLFDDAPSATQHHLVLNYMTDMGVDVHVVDGRTHVTAVLCSDTFG